MFGRITARIRDFWQRKGPRTAVDRALVYAGIPLFLFVTYLVGLHIYANAVAPPEVTFENRAGADILVFSDGYYVISVPAGGQVKEDVRHCGDGCLIEAVDEDGLVLFTLPFSKKIAREMDHRVVVSADSDAQRLR